MKKKKKAKRTLAAFEKRWKKYTDDLHEIHLQIHANQLKLAEEHLKIHFSKGKARSIKRDF